MKFWLLGFLLLSLGASAEPVHAIAMHGKPKYDENFTHFDYVNPNAPKGGVLKQASFGSFDTFNPFTIKGNSAPGVGLIFETLMTSSADEPFTQYGLIADKIDTPADRSYVRFHINDKAYFNNGDKMTPDDVIFSFETLRDFGAPQYRYYYRDVAKVSAEKDGWIRFDFNTNENRELPLILGQMPVLSKKDWKDKDFTATRLDVPVGSGAYKLKDFALNRYVIYERDKNYWGKDLPVNQGINNFDEIRFDIYRDTTVAVEAFKSGAYDIRIENEAKKWATAYNTPDMKTGKMKRQEFSHHLPSGMQGFVFNTRKELFKDKKVREALQYVLDFNWLNDKLFYSSYTRTKSYFDNSYLAATGRPSTEEIKLLTPFKDKLDPRVLSEEILVPQLDSANPRVQLMKALSLLKQAGWTVQNGILQN
ncbi:MAG: extracellular solute-binding protein, partial [Alphaproteobacteria bacterium]